MSRPLITALEKLSGSQAPVPSSTFGEKEKQALDSFQQQTGIIERYRQGRGTVYSIKNRDNLMLHLSNLRPHEATALNPDLPSRSANIATARNSKHGEHRHDVHYLLLKAVGEEVTWNNADGRQFNLSAQTRLTGAGTLAIQTDDDWHTHSPLWLVENQLLFDRTDWLPAGTKASVCLYHGQLHGLILKWFKSYPRASEIILFPDYDGVGLLNYARLLDYSISPCSFWLMPDWESLLKAYGNPDIWQQQKSLTNFHSAVKRLSAHTIGTDLTALMIAMQKQGLALEQESTWLSLL